MKSERVFGRDTRVSLTLGGNLVKTVSAIKSFSGKLLISNPSEKYLGESGPRYDYIYGGFEGSLKFDWDDDDVMALYKVLVEAASDRSKAVRLNISTAFMFSTGRTKRCIMPGCVFGDLPFDIPAQDRYVEGGFDVKCGNKLQWII